MPAGYSPEFIQVFRGIDQITPIYARLSANQKALIGDMKIAKASVDELNAAFGRQVGVGEINEQQQKQSLKTTLQLAEAEIAAAAVLNQESKVTLEASLRQAQLNQEKVEYIAASIGAREATSEEMRADIAAAKVQAQREVQTARFNLSMVEKIAALRLATIRQAEETAGTELAVGGKARELIAREGVTVAALKEALAKEKSALAGAKDSLVAKQQAAAKGKLGVITELVNVELLKEEIQLRRNNVQLLQNAVAAQRAGAGHQAAAAGVASHTAAQAALTPHLRRNTWMGVSAGNILERAGAGARLSGFDIGFMTFQMGQLSLATAVAVAGLNMFADEQDSIAQLRFAVENLGLSWANTSASIENAVVRLRDSTGNTAVEIREIMATLGAVTGGLIHSQDELVEQTELVLDVMRRTSASAQLASRIIARTMAGNLESLRERFPGLIEQIENLKASGASLEEMGDWGMRVLEQQVGGASEAISDAGRLVADLRNILIELGETVGAVVLPPFQAFVDVLNFVNQGFHNIIGTARDVMTFFMPAIGLDEFLHEARQFVESQELQDSLDDLLLSLETFDEKSRDLFFRQATQAAEETPMREWLEENQDFLDAWIHRHQRAEEELTEGQQKEVERRKQLALEEQRERIRIGQLTYEGLRIVYETGEETITGIIEGFGDRWVAIREANQDKIAANAAAWYAEQARLQREAQQAAEEAFREFEERARTHYDNYWNWREERDRAFNEAFRERMAEQEEIQHKRLESQLRMLEREKRAVWSHHQWLESLFRRRIELEEETTRQIRAVGLAHISVVRDLFNEDQDIREKARKAWTSSIEGMASEIVGIGRPLVGMMEDIIGQKGLVWWVEGLGQTAYAVANWFNPLAATRHAAAAAAFFYAASQAGKHGGTQTTGGGGSSAGRRQRVERRRQTFDEAPDPSLRSPSGMTFVILNDLRGAVGVDGDRVGLAILDRMNRGARWRSGRRLDDSFVRDWRR